MDLSEAVLLARKGQAVLFLGAGFSIGATGINGQPVPTGGRLARTMLDDLGISEDLDLGRAANFYEDKFGRHALRTLLLTTFTSKALTDDHRACMKEGWRRVYTTNYDDVVENALQQLGKRHVSHLASSPREVIETGALDIVHLHGSVRALESAREQDEIVLTSADYAADLLAASQWMPLLRNDLAVAKAILFVGYSLGDLDIARLLTRAEELQSKVVFLSAVSEPDHVVSWLSRYGTVEKVGLRGLIDALAKAPSATTPVEQEFISLEAITDKDPSAAAGAEDAIKLWGQGILDEGVFAHERAANGLYSLKRFGEQQILNTLERGSRKYLVHSDFGNGKSVFLSQLGVILAKRGYQVFRLSRRSSTTNAELDRLKALPDSACLVVDNAHRFRNELREFCAGLPANKVVIASVRSHNYEVDADEMDRMLGGHSITIDLNQLRAQEPSAINNIFEHHGLWGGAVGKSEHERLQIVSKKCNAELRSFLLWSFTNGSIAAKVREWTDGVRNAGGNVEQVVCAILMIELTGIPFYFDEICDLLRVRPDAARDELLRTDAAELVSLRGWQVAVRSPIIAEHVLQQITSPETAESVLVRLIRSLTELADADADRRDLLRELIRIRFVGILFRGEGREKHILSLYDSISTIRYVRDNPQFWLQYAMARMRLEQFDLAEKYFASAYSLSATIPGYQTTQIDNQYVQHLLLSRARGAFPDTDAAALKACQLIGKQLMTRGHTNSVYSLRLIEPLFEFWEKRADTVRAETKTAMYDNAVRLRAAVASYTGDRATADERTRWNNALNQMVP